MEFIIGKVQDLPEEELFAILEDADLIYHFAGSVGVEYVDKNPSLTIFNNLELASYLVPIFDTITAVAINVALINVFILYCPYYFNVVYFTTFLMLCLYQK